MQKETNPDILDFHNDPGYQDRVRARLDYHRSQRDEIKHSDGGHGLMHGIGELGGRKAKAAFAGVVATAALIGGAQWIAERVSNVANPHEVTKTQVTHNARDPLAGYSQVTTTTSYKQSVIGNKK